MAKPRLSNAEDPSGPVARGTLVRVLADTLALLHPFTPYVTEVLWKQLHETIGRLWGRRTDRYSELRTAATARLEKVEMSYIGG